VVLQDHFIVSLGSCGFPSSSVALDRWIDGEWGRDAEERHREGATRKIKLGLKGGKRLMSWQTGLTPARTD
jgi:hypothetical protein